MICGLFIALFTMPMFGRGTVELVAAESAISNAVSYGGFIGAAIGLAVAFWLMRIADA